MSRNITVSDLIIKGASQNNLKSLDLAIPSEAITVVVGPSGSGKSSLVFDTIYAEGQRRYIESLSTYARNFLESVDKPDVEHIENISPTVAIEQKNRVKSSRGTVASLTELYDYLRLLYSKIGTTYCPDCKIPVKLHTVDSIVDDLLHNHGGERTYILFRHKGAVQDIRLAGFVRIMVNGEVLDLSEVDDASAPEEYYVVYDRFKIGTEESGRIWEAVERTLFIGKGECTVYFTEKNSYTNYRTDLVCPSCKKFFTEPDPRFFSFDSPIGACSACKGFGNKLGLDEKKLVPDPMKSLLGGAIELFNKPSLRHHFYMMINYLRSLGVDVNKPFVRLSEKDKAPIYTGGSSGKEKYLGLNRMFAELEKKKYKVYVRVILSKYKSPYVCDVCNGSRLRKEALDVFVGDKNIFQLQGLPVTGFYSWLGNLKLTKHEKRITSEILKQLFQRTSFLIDVGLGYLALGRQARTLSNGEAQRINIANQLGSALVDTIYVLDEPSIGLHQRDISKLVEIIKRLRDNGNKVIVVEHETEIIKSSDYIVELGPESGIRGGELVYSGYMGDYLSSASTLTSRYLQKPARHEKFSRRSVGEATGMLVLEDLSENNIKNVTFRLPLKRFVCVTGVSGSGKSTLVTKSLYSVLSREFGNFDAPLVNCRGVPGIENIKGVVLMDQEPISRSKRSTPITFISGFDYIRDVFAQTPLARSRGYTASNFSFN
ncbi:MAG: excinuclease ABC subunit UvrA, partial [Oligoflexia bacterium]|nr:excinuclease ABC subunit UvrA [Oligoflexia bacterium]